MVRHNLSRDCSIRYIIIHEFQESHRAIVKLASFGHIFSVPIILQSACFVEPALLHIQIGKLHNRPLGVSLAVHVPFSAAKHSHVELLGFLKFSLQRCLKA